MEEGAEELVGGQGRVDAEGGRGARVEARQEVAREGGLARARLPRDEDEPALLLAPELEMREGFGVARRKVEVLRIGSEVEQLLGKGVEVLVHLACLSGRDVAGDA